MAAGRREAGPGDLGAARKALGLSIEQAAAQTRIPQRYLEALEKGDLAVFPPGPFLSGYTRQYRAFLRLPDAPPPRPPARAEPEYTVTEPARPGRKSRANAVRLAIIGALALLAFVLAAAVSQELLENPDTGPGVPPDQKVTLKTPEPLDAHVETDGRTVFDGTIPGMVTREFDAHDRIELDLETLDDVVLTYNHHPLKPLGATSRPRRLVFIDDTQPE
jgi:hypothetical protein